MNAAFAPLTNAGSMQATTSSSPFGKDRGAAIVESWQVIIEPGSYSRAEVLEHLNRMELAAHGITVELRKPQRAFRSVDTAILVATIGAVSSNLTALIVGLLQLKAHRKDQRISIELASGGKVDVPADISPEDLEKLVKTLGSPGKKPRRFLLP